LTGGSSPGEAIEPLPPSQPRQSKIVPAVANTVATSLSTQPIVIQPPSNVKPQIALPKTTPPQKTQEIKAAEPEKKINVKDETSPDIKHDTLNPFKKP
jgi:hypothetical protein